MTNTEDATPRREGARPRRSRQRWPVIAAAVIVIAVAAGVAVALATDDHERSATGGVDSVQLAALQRGCQGWMNDRGSFTGADNAWCSGMVGWMRGQMHGGQMMGSTMWGDAQRMRATCNRWLATDPEDIPSGADPRAWCDDMVTWMDQHTDDWGDWMNH